MTTMENVADPGPPLRGDVLWPADPGFNAACQGFNLAVAHRPDVVVRPTCIDDIAAAIAYASHHGLRIHVHTTGHGTGARADGGVLVATGRLDDVVVDPARGTATVSAGARWDTAIGRAAGHGLMTLCGSSPTVGIVGYTLGGGMSPFGRTYGFASDRVRRAQMVCADGGVVDIDPDSHPEMFWGLRGGKLNAGVITELEFDLIEQPSYYGGGIFYPGDAAADLMHGFIQWTATLPAQATSSLALLRLPDAPEVPEPLRGRLSVHLRFAYTGDAAVGGPLIEPMRAMAEPLIDLVDERGPESIGMIHQDPQDPMPARDESTLLGELPPAAIDALLGAAGPEAVVPLVIVELRHMGGALSADTASASAVSGRDAAFNLSVIGVYPPPLVDAVDHAIATVLAAVQPWSLGRSQANFGGDSGNIRNTWAPDVRERLDALKATWDPDGLFA